MPLIRETIVTTIDAEGRVHIAPLGIIADGEQWIIAPFRPSKTLDNLRAVSTESFISSGFGPRPGLPASEAALHARDKIRAASDRVGPAAWPILTRVILEGACVRDCRGFVPEIVTPWRADAVVTDRLRVALDALGGLLGVTGGRR